MKTGEHFSDYRYKAKTGVTVHFELAAAHTEQDNVKGERRFFVPRIKDASYDGEARALTLPFEYRPLSAKEKTAYGAGKTQERIIEVSATGLRDRLAKRPEAMAALEPAGSLERHLRRYTRRNTSDFFVHKDLKGFLEGELDFYLKNEVLNVDDLEAWGPERSDGWFEVMRAIKAVGRGIIAFLAQIEDFQKKLFEKKKLVVSARYCLTLDRVPEELYAEVAANDAQREEWKKLFAIDGIEENLTTPGYSEPLTTDFLKANPFLVLDTKFFDEDFKDRLLASIEDLDEQTNGLLIESENFQALNLLQERYREQVKCVYIDPPYNTGGGDFIYKDNYQHSSWLSMMCDRLKLSLETMSNDGTLFISIDDDEVHNLRTLTNTLLLPDNFIANIVWQKRYVSNVTAQWMSDMHDHILFYGKRKEQVNVATIERTAQQLSDYKNPDNDPRGVWRAQDLSASKPYSAGQFVITTPVGKEVKPPPGRCWRCSRKQYDEWLRDGRIWFGKYGTGRPMLKAFLSESSQGITPNTWWSFDFAGHNKEATLETKALFGDTPPFSTPKPVKLLDRILKLVAVKQGIVMDYFAGSGTTGHAVMDLNREDGGNRKYILVEMGEYFETVLKPRILKVIYSKDWKDGRPVSREGTSHILKYMKLESYEDALDNIAFTNGEAGQRALELYGDDYLLRYMLDFETRGSDTLLNVEKLAAPFRYTLRLRDGSGQTREARVDLPETFAYLLGLRVSSRRAYGDGDRRYLVYRGTMPEGNDVAVVWRDTEGWDEEDFARDAAFVEESGMAADAEEVFVNGDSLVAGARALEGVFKKRMLAGPTVG